jgi:histidine triad (HIT) family protein
MTGYDDSNIFARILRGELPCHRVYEDDDVLAFLDIMPEGEGHTLVLPKAPSRNLLDADPEVLSRAIVAVQRIAKAAQKAFEADGVRIVQFNEAAAGQTVFHLHFHIVPIRSEQPLGEHAKAPANHEKLAADAEKLIAALGF